MKKALLTVAILATCVAAMAQTRAVTGDVNGDGFVTTTDATMIYNYLLTGDQTFYSTSDVNGDGSVTVADVTLIYNIILGVSPVVEHEYVDLGLPSGTLWATMNVGATTPEECGDYFAWGETTPMDYNPYWDTYQWSNGKWNKLTKYCTGSNYGDNGFVDGKTELDPEDDAAYVNWGSQWRMPSYDQMEELRTKCTWQWKTSNGVNGYLVKSKSNGASLFLPVTDYYSTGQIYNAGYMGYYWSRTLHTTPYKAYYLFFYSSSNLECTNGDRYSGFAVRAVKAPQK